MDDKRVLVAIRVRPKLEFANAQLQQNEKYHLEAAAKTSDSSVRLSDGKTARDSKTHNFTYDLVFDKDCTQLDVYEETTLDAVDAVLQGNNATILTYGQTGSGKTYTVLGSVKKNPLTNDIITADTGLFLRALKDILNFAEQRSNDLHVVVGLSVLEIYLDEVRDLLSSEPSPPTLNVSVIRDTLSIPNMTYKAIKDLNDAVNAYKLANARRVSRATSANDTSSRSHAVFSIELFQQPRTVSNPDPLEAGKLCELREKVQLHLNTTVVDTPTGTGGASNRTPMLQTQQSFSMTGSSSMFGGATPSPPPTPSSQPKSTTASSATDLDALAGFGARASNPLLTVPGQPPIMFSKLVLTDLAGSEKIKNSRVKGEGLEELKKINASLTSLGNVVHSLYEGAKHIPYRDSKLTILLRESFSAPNSKIVLIANASPTVLTFDETLSTMFFADKVKGMKVENPQSADVARMEVEVLALTKVLDELSTELRVAREAHDVVPVIRRHGPSTIVDRALGFIKRSPGSPSGSAREKEMRGLGEVSLEQAKQLAKRRAELQAAELKDLERLTKDEMVQEHGRIRKHMDDLLLQVKTEHLSNAKDFSDVVLDFETEIRTESESLKVLEASRLELQPRHDRLPEDIRNADATIASMTTQIEAMERKMFEKYKDAEADWDQHQALHHKRERQWAASSKFAESCKAMWIVKSDFNGVCMDSLRLHAHVSDTKLSSETAEVSHWIRAAVGRMARNAVTMSLAKARKAPSTRPSSRSTTRRLDPNGDAGPSDDATEVARQAQRMRRRGTLYDQPSLMGEIITYVQYGCMILKYGRSGAPHYRLFYVINEENGGGARLCWDEEDDGQRLGKGSMVPLESVTRIMLGQYTQIFKRIPGGEGFHNSFSLEYISKQQTRTLDLVCDTDAELESWVIALCYLTKKNPTFLEPYHGLTMMPSYNLLSPSEVDVCSQWHIQPDILLSCKRRIDESSTKTKIKPLKMSPGEVRLLAGIDIFRSCALWHHFNREGLVENAVDKLYSYLTYD